MGRRSKFNKNKFNEICERIALGETLRQICESDGMPDRITVYRWLQDDNNQDLRNQYARAYEFQSESWSDEIISVSDDISNDTLTDDKGNAYGNHAAVQRDRLRVDARKWIMSKRRPKVWGDKSEQTDQAIEAKPIKLVFRRAETRPSKLEKDDTKQRNGTE